MEEISQLPAPWSIRQERVRSFDGHGNVIGVTRHKHWVIRYQGKRVASYFKWRSCIEHIDWCVRKYGTSS